MHFGRSHSRSKSRSPAPGSPFPSATPTSQYPRPPTFLPPSHYAAAAGLAYTKPHDVSTKDDRLSLSYHTHSPVEDVESKNPSTSSFGPVGRLMGRAPSGWVNSKRSTDTNFSETIDREKDSRDRRMSQLGDIPLLETQLLPSLRDTVDRMTQTPHSRSDNSDYTDSQSMSTSYSVSSRRRREELIASPSANSFLPPNPGSINSRSTPEPTATTAIPRLNAARSPGPKSVLKSAARRSIFTPTIPTSRSPYPPHQTERLAASESAHGANYGSDTSSETNFPRDPTRLNRVAFPSGSILMPKLATNLPRLKVGTKSKSNPSTPQASQRPAVFATPQPDRPSASLLPQSSLPRPRPSRSNHLPSDSGSELERRVSQRHSPGRLIVTNAVIVPSSSESDHSSKSRNRRSQWIAPHNVPALPPASEIPSRSPSRLPSNPRPHKDSSIPSADTHNYRSTTVGLGLNVQGVELGRRVKSSLGSDDEGICDDGFSDHSLLTDEPMLVPCSEDDDESIYDDDPRRVPSRSSRHLNPDHEKRRQEALLGLVDGLHRDYGRTSPSGARSSVLRSESDVDYSAQGLAISGSADLQDARTANHRNSRASARSEYSPEQAWDAESMYSDDEGDTKAGDDSLQKHRASPRPLTSSTAEDVDGHSARSLRQSRLSWRRPSTNSTIGRSQHVNQQDATALLKPKERQRSVSPMTGPVSPRSVSPILSRSTSPLPGSSSPQPGSRSANNRSQSSYYGTGPRRSRAMSMSARKESMASMRVQDSTVSFSHGPHVPTEAWIDGAKRPEDLGIRERLAFGIPESLSYSGNNVTPGEQDSTRPPLSRIGSGTSSRPGLSRADSDLSVAESTWQEQARFSKELSRGAAALFETLTSKAIKNTGSRPWLNYGDEDNHKQDRTPMAEPASWSSRGASLPSLAHPEPQSRSRSPVPLAQVKGRARRRSFESASLSSASSSPASVYDEPVSPVQHASTLPRPLSQSVASQSGSPGTWRSTLSPDIYSYLRKHYGLTEMERQELIHEFFVAEKTFIRNARHVVGTYLLPLRARDSRTWLPGLPADVARLFDWLEDIVNLHVAIARTLASVVAIWKSGAIVLRMSGTLRVFVPQLEVYMPYLVKLENVRETLRWHAEKGPSVFGEYLRLKERDRVGGEWALEKLLEEPASRLRQFVDFFERLCKVTPREHPDYLAAISLLYSTRMAVRVMDEVKVREEEYDFVKDVSSRIDGLSENTPLARRARRLLWYGPLVQYDTTPSTSNAPVRPPPINEGDSIATNGNSLGRVPAQRMSKLVTAVRDWDARRSRGGSISSFASSTLSVQTSETLSSASSASVLVTPRSDHFPPGVVTRGHSGSLPKKGLIVDMDNRRRERVESDVRSRERCNDRTLNAMVFTDLIVLATPPQDDGKPDSSEREQRCHLLNGPGLSRIVEISEGIDGTFILGLVAIMPEHLDTGFIGEDTSVVAVTLTLPTSSDDAARKELIDALRKCQQHAIRSLSFPSLPGTMMEDVEIDTRQSLVGILSSGLPLPKSPSIQFGEASNGQRRDAVDGEREERGWWTLRFQQVLRELQREDVPVSMLATSCGPGSSAPQ